MMGSWSKQPEFVKTIKKTGGKKLRKEANNQRASEEHKKAT